MTNKEKLKDTIKERCYMYKAEPFVLASGRKSNHYFNMKLVTMDPNLITIICHLMLTIYIDQTEIFSQRVSAVGGLTAGADPMVYHMAETEKWYPLIVRKEAKDHGTGGQIIGLLGRVKNKVLCIEDVSTTGGSALRAVQVFRDHSLQCNTVLTLLDREEGAKENMLKEDVRLISLFKKSDFGIGD